MPANGSFDVVVAGGRVAGALTAVLFARRGLHVAVVDRAEFPSSTLSTHFFRGDGLVRDDELLDGFHETVSGAADLSAS